MSAPPPHTERDFLSSAHERLLPQSALVAEGQLQPENCTCTALGPGNSRHFAKQGSGFKHACPAPLVLDVTSHERFQLRPRPASRRRALASSPRAFPSPFVERPVFTSSLGAFPPLWCSSTGRARSSLLARECSFLRTLCRYVSRRLLSANPGTRDPTGSASRNRALDHA